MSSDRDRDLDPEQAVDRFLTRRSGTNTEETVRSYKNRLQHFIDFCDEHGIGSMQAVDGWTMDEYYHWRSSHDVEPVTIKGSMVALRQLLKFCAELEIVDDTLPDRVPSVELSPSQETSETRLPTEQASALIAMYRDSRRYYGTTWHAFLELAWHTGARVGGIRSLDIEDFDREQGTLYFRHRPDSGTTLKNKAAGERIIEIPAASVDALGMYIDRERADSRDDAGRRPLFATTRGRASIAALRGWSYLGTQPCLYRDCPHGRERRNCEYTDRSHASKCPSSRSPHSIRTGSITWQLGEIDDIEVVAERVNAAPSTIRRYYDVATPAEKYEDRRQGLGSQLDVTEVESHG